MPDRRVLAERFRERVQSLIEQRQGGLSRFARDTGVDRSAISQLLDPRNDRLPRAETLYAIADSCGVTADWLLSLSNAQSGGHQVAPMLEFEQALDPSGFAPSERWRTEARGYKLRYIPSQLPHLLTLPAPDRPRAGAAPETGMTNLDPEAEARLHDTEAWLADMDVEICMAVQTLEDLARGGRIWTATPAEDRRAQLEHIRRMLDLHYPALRLHLYDERRISPAPYTVFGPVRAVIYLGQSFLVVTAAEQVRAIGRHFDSIVRGCISDLDEVGAVLARTVARVR
ncbi:MAG TPA: helix-turn-helix transcriptional regulator [Thermohalobaculum sp.]|nr:helix-turn-helix transcriptional regulator [Thermohalobaculum sp.]